MLVVRNNQLADVKGLEKLTQLRSPSLGEKHKRLYSGLLSTRRIARMRSIGSGTRHPVCTVKIANALKEFHGNRGLGGVSDYHEQQWKCCKFW